jgi:hypothetical protein
VECKLPKRWASALFSTFIFLLTACGQQPQAAVSDPVTEALGREAQTLSMDWLEQAMIEADSEELREAIGDVHNLLEERSISTPPASLAATCDSNEGRFTAAFVTNEFANSNIYVCAQSKRLGKIFLAQVLIHEALHLRGERDECEVTRMEIAIMTSALRIPYKNAYVAPCGLE